MRGPGKRGHKRGEERGGSREGKKLTGKKMSVGKNSQAWNPERCQHILLGLSKYSESVGWENKKKWHDGPKGTQGNHTAEEKVKAG